MAKVGLRLFGDEGAETMSDCKNSLIVVLSELLKQSGRDVSEILRRYGLSVASLQSAPQGRAPWSLYTELLAELASTCPSPEMFESLGGDSLVCFGLLAQLVSLHFELREIYELLCTRALEHLMGGALRVSSQVQGNGVLRCTQVLKPGYAVSYPYWTLGLGQFKAFPRIWGLSDAAVDAELTDEWADYVIHLPATPLPTVPDTPEIQAMHAKVRTLLLDELISNEELRSPILASRFGSYLRESLPPCCPERNLNGNAAIESSLQWYVQELGVNACSLWFWLGRRLARVGTLGEPLMGARVRRHFWFQGQLLGALEIPRSPLLKVDPCVAKLEAFLLSHTEELTSLYYAYTTPTIDGAKSMGQIKLSSWPPSGASLSARLAELSMRWKLTLRQREVLSLLIDGLANKEIAARLGCSVGTVENHVTRIFRRANVENRVALTSSFWRCD